jgi:hypothetical protein
MAAGFARDRRRGRILCLAGEGDGRTIPVDHLDSGVTKAYLLRDYQASLRAKPALTAGKSVPPVES